MAVKVPTIEEETARDLVRSREDTRQYLMGARHRLSKLLLRHGSSIRTGRRGRENTTLGCGSTGPETCRF